MGKRIGYLRWGIAESPAFPGSSKATGYWFPLNERGLATSSFDGPRSSQMSSACRS